MKHREPLQGYLDHLATVSIATRLWISVTVSGLVVT